METLNIDVNKEPNNVKKNRKTGIGETEHEKLNKYKGEGAVTRCKANCYK